MTALAWQMLRHHRWRFVATFVALFAGASIVIACGALMETGIRSDMPPTRLAGADIVVTGDVTAQVEGLDESVLLSERVPLPADLAAELGAVSGVADTVGDVTLPAAVAVDGEVVGGETSASPWTTAALGPFGLVEGAAPATGDVVVDVELAQRTRLTVGQDLTIMVGTATADYRVSGLVEPDAELSSAVVFMDDTTIQALSPRPESVDNVAVVVEPSAEVDEVRDGIEDVLGNSSASILTGDNRGFAEDPSARATTVELIALAGAFGGIAVVVAVFVVASTLAISIRQRQRELALIRAVGMTPGQLRRMVVAETVLVAVVATALGVVAGDILGRWLYDAMVGTGLVPDAMAYRYGRIPMLVGIGTALLTAVAAALVAARRAARTRPVEAMTGAAVAERWLTWPRAIFAALFGAGGIALVIVTATVLSGPIAQSTAGPAVLCLAIAAALLGPGIARIVLWLVGLPVRLLGGKMGRLAVVNLRSQRVLAAAAMTPLVLAISVATANIYAQTTRAAALEDDYLENLRADAVLTSATGAIDPALVEAVAARAEVGGASAFAASVGYVTSPEDLSQSIDGRPLQGFAMVGDSTRDPFDMTSGSLADLAGNSVVIPDAMQRRVRRGARERAHPPARRWRDARRAPRRDVHVGQLLRDDPPAC